MDPRSERRVGPRHRTGALVLARIRTKPHTINRLPGFSTSCHRAQVGSRHVHGTFAVAGLEARQRHFFAVVRPCSLEGRHRRCSSHLFEPEHAVEGGAVAAGAEEVDVAIAV